MSFLIEKRNLFIQYLLIMVHLVPTPVRSSSYPHLPKTNPFLLFLSLENKQASERKKIRWNKTKQTLIGQNKQMNRTTTKRVKDKAKKKIHVDTETHTLIHKDIPKDTKSEKK